MSGSTHNKRGGLQFGRINQLDASVLEGGMKAWISLLNVVIITNKRPSCGKIGKYSLSGASYPSIRMPLNMPAMMMETAIMRQLLWATLPAISCLGKNRHYCAIPASVTPPNNCLKKPEGKRQSGKKRKEKFIMQ